MKKIKEFGNFCNNSINFFEKFYYSKDKKTIMGEVMFSELLFLEYRDSEAGSNPREYTGLKKANLNVLKSLLKDPSNMFRFLHSGIIVSITNPRIVNNITVKYDDCCLTNGNQTRFIILHLVLIKLMCNSKKLNNVNQKDIEKLVETYFAKCERATRILAYVKLSRINEMINFIVRNNKYLNNFIKMPLSKLLSSKIRIHMNLIDNIIEDIDDKDKLDEYTAGTLIAEANNDTQKVKVDDIFGTKYKPHLEKRIFNNFINQFGSNLKIEYRLGEIIEKSNKVHILTLLRLIVATGILSREKEIFNLTNQRDPIYKLFEKLLSQPKAHRCEIIISQLVPLLYNIRIKYVIPVLESHKRELILKYKEKVASGEIDKKSVIYKEIVATKGNKKKIEKIIRKNVGYNVEHIMPVLIFTIRRLLCEINDLKALDINIDDSEKEDFLKSLVEIIYDKYVETKVKGLPSSLTTFVRSEDFYSYGRDLYVYLKNQKKLKESTLIEKNRYIVNK